MRPEECNSIKRGYAQIDLDAVRENIINMLEIISKDARMILVIKTDGYGHGAYPIAKMAEDIERIWGYAVATCEEAFDLREAGIKKPVLILGYTFEYSYEELIRQDIRPAVFRDDQLASLSAAACRLGKDVRIHIKVDTGMNRIGIKPDDEGLSFVKRALGMPGICVEGLFTHFARADELDKRYANLQLGSFKDFSGRILDETGFRIPFIHCSNSAGILELPQANMDLVRAGITLYGLMPSDEVDAGKCRLTPVMSLISHIVHIKEVPDKTQISYGGTYTSSGKRMIATIPVGYGDGYPRMLSNAADVIIRGKRAPIRGRICMDQFMVDVTDINSVSLGDKVTLIGRDGHEQITMEELGDLSGRFNYELACDIGKRIPRVYTKHGQIDDIILDGKHKKW